MKEKLKSRKFIVFTIWLILTIIIIAIGKNIADVLQYFFVISVVYIGGQSTIDTIEKLKK